MIALAFAYFAIVALGLLVAIPGRTPFFVRVLAVLVLPALAFSIWKASQPTTGWPSSSTPGGTFVAGYVREPEPGDPGEIDLWLMPPGSTHPRAFQLPYTRQMHKGVDAAQQATKRGQRVGVARRRDGTVRSRGRFRFYLEPPPLAPRKPNG